MVIIWEGKKYIRMGHCRRCGSCCTGFAIPCGSLSFIDGKADCNIYHFRDTAMAEDQFRADAISGNPQGCIEFPDNPGAIQHPSLRDKCGYYFVEVEDVLVACPTYDGKEYCMERYLAAYDAFTYPAKSLLIIDNSDTDDFYLRWNGRVSSMGGNLLREPDLKGLSGNKKIAESMEIIRRYFLTHNFRRWFNLEIDIIAPTNTLETLLAYDRDNEMDWISHVYPNRVNAYESTSGFGCSLFSRRLMSGTDFADAPSDTTTDGWYWNNKVKDHHYKAMEIWGVLTMGHLNG